MKVSVRKSVCLFLSCLFVLALFAVFPLSSASVQAAEAGEYGEAYRNRLAYSASSGWNNDPNGLLYADGVYHMYYQYSYNQTTGETPNYWADMSWGHATSTDLVHWKEQEVAIPAYQTVNGTYYAMMFSGSAVYDEYNTSGLFSEDADGTVAEGQGIVAILTQPDDAAGGQRQILAYSTDGGDSFTIYGEILAASEDGGLGDGEFRDPKVFWEESLGKWLMVVGGGSVRMYSSENLLDWEYLGETGYWGECPDLSAFTVNGEQKYVLVLSPEDKENSHLYNGTSREDTYYPAEYYVVGELDETGLFIGETQLARLSGGIDSYAFQSFNNVPDGKVYGVSWSASWKTVSEYEAYRENYNGGMTVVTELALAEEDGEYVLTRYPVAGYESLRSSAPQTAERTVAAGEDALEGMTATVADLEITLDFSAGDASFATLLLRESAYEHIALTYDAETETLTLDRSESSLLAADTSLYNVPYSAQVPLQDGKLTLRLLLDRAFVSVFANEGRASFFSAVFPAASSDGLSLTADGSLGVSASVWEMNGIFGDAENGELLLTANKIDTTVGSVETVVASSYAAGFSGSDVTYTVTEGGENISLTQEGGAAQIEALAAGSARVSVSYGEETQVIELYIYEDGFASDLSFTTNWGGFSYIGNRGLYFSTGTSDAFRFSDAAGEDILYSATFTPENDAAQAGALVFGVSGNYTGYYAATADLQEGKIKLWRSGTGDVAVADHSFSAGEAFTLTLSVTGQTARVYLNGGAEPVLTCELEEYAGGGVGLNVYNGAMFVNDVHFANAEASENALVIGSAEVLGAVNVTDGNAILGDGDYTVEDGVFRLTDEYLLTLEGDSSYTIKVTTAERNLYFAAETSFSAVSVTPSASSFLTDEALTFTVGRDTAVLRVLIGGTEVAFSQDGRQVTIAAEELEGLRTGAQYLTVYTENGRAEARVVLAERDLTEQNLSKTVSIALLVSVAVLLAGSAAAYFVLAGRRKKGAAV